MLFFFSPLGFIFRPGPSVCGDCMFVAFFHAGRVNKQFVLPAGVNVFVCPCVLLRFLEKYLEKSNVSWDESPATFLFQYLAVIRNGIMLHEQ